MNLTIINFELSRINPIFNILWEYNHILQAIDILHSAISRV